MEVIKISNGKRNMSLVGHKMLAGLLIFFALFLIGCTNKKEKLNVYNWSEYISMDVLKEFEKEFKVKVNYDTFSTNEELLAKLQTGAQGFDVIFPSDYMIEIMRELNILATLNKENIPNLKNIEDRFLGLYFDPNNDYSVPYMWGTTGIIVNPKYITEKVDSWSLFWDTRYKGRSSVLNDMRETIGMALKYTYSSLNSTDNKELEFAAALLKEQNKLVKVYDSENYRNLLLMEEIWFAHSYSGDAVWAMEEDPNLLYILPKEGGSLWIDNMAITKNSPNKELAEKFIDFLLRPDISARLTEEIMYGNPNYASLEFTDPDLLANEVLFPKEEDLDNFEWINDLGSVTTLYDRIWTEIKGQ